MDKQVLKARAVAILAEVVSRDSFGRALKIKPGAGSVYTVEIDWGVDTLYTRCTCKGSVKGICYHMIGATIKAFEEQGGEVAVGFYKGNLKRLQRTGGRFWTVKSMGRPVYVLVKGKMRWSKKVDEAEVILPGELSLDVLSGKVSVK